MNKKLRLLIPVSCLLLCAFAPLREASADDLAIGLEPYGTISWAGIDGQSELGAGANITLGITKNLSVVGFGEGDNTDGLLVERFGAGLRYTAALGSKVSLDAGVAGAYDTIMEKVFLRLPLGANLYALKTKNADAGLRVQYAFDIGGDGRNGSATGRLFAGPVINLRF
jgi:hypothetical protein